MSYLVHEKWLVIGGGISGYGAAALLSRAKKSVVVSDKRPLSEPLSTRFRQLSGVEVVIGDQTEELLEGIQAIAISPGVPPKIPLIQAAIRKKIPIFSEISLGLAAYKGQVFAVTGTNGKSTVCVMLETMLNGLGLPATAGGNIGDSLAVQVTEQRTKANLVLELSSYQIESSPGLAVSHATFTSFSFDHIERHGTLENYFRAKWDLIQAVKPGGLIVMPLYIYRLALDYQRKLPTSADVILILNEKDCPSATNGHSWVRINKDGELTDSKQEILGQLASFGFTSAHNRLNATVAAIFGKRLRPDLSWAAILQKIAAFTPLPFRCEEIGKTRAGHVVINDSKSTNVESTLTALSITGAPFILMMGGQGKLEPYSPLIEKREAISEVICFGASGPTIHAELSGKIPSRLFPTLNDACAALPEIYQNNPHSILLSPGCASFDEFKNYEHRGVFFSERMTQLLNLHKG